ncbi:aldo/keto reductase [Sutterella sp.]|uniref:aldo/keto reductase n=1 Tax=Sutterella sp. TaxID=1981025 RepID=UPI0026DF2E06|nr:aldo/keto reductase [Sutterella sp.]MDO5531716.1 aldo/keto reductase [Sutterella sp.]
MTPALARYQLTPDYATARVINGGWQLSTGHALADPLDLLDAKRGFEVLLDHGFDTFDGADIYTGVENFYGGIIRSRRAAGKTLPQIHTKFVPDLKDLARVDMAYVERIITRSIQRLGVERLDMVQYHWWDYDVPGMVETAGLLVRLQEKGLIRCISTTNFSAAQLKKLTDAGIPVVTNQCQYSLLDRRPEKALVKLCEETGVKLICYGTVAGGFLSRKWLGAEKPVIEKLENRSLVKYLLVIEDTLGWSGYQQLLRKLDAMSARTGFSISALATLYILGKPQVAAAVVGTRSSRHVADTLTLAGAELPADCREELDRFISQFGQIEGDCFDVERADGSRHKAIMRMNLVDSVTGK